MIDLAFVKDASIRMNIFFQECVAEIEVGLELWIAEARLRI